jgi:CheY-like chemotaxis protein
VTKDRGGPAANAGRVLVVEDSPSAQRLLQDVLLRLGVELPNLRISGTVVDALKTYTQWRPDCVFVDIELNASPVSALPPSGPPASPQDPKDGIELAQLILTRNPAVKVVICSATDPTDPRVARLVNDGKVEFIMKPLLASRIEEALARVGKATPRRAT